MEEDMTVKPVRLLKLFVLVALLALVATTVIAAPAAAATTPTTPAEGVVRFESQFIRPTLSVTIEMSDSDAVQEYRLWRSVQRVPVGTPAFEIAAVYPSCNQCTRVFTEETVLTDGTRYMYYVETVFQDGAIEITGFLSIRPAVNFYPFVAK